MKSRFIHTISDLEFYEVSEHFRRNNRSRNKHEHYENYILGELRVVIGLVALKVSLSFSLINNSNSIEAVKC